MAAKPTIDKWKLKKWIEVYAPALFKEKYLGDTIAENPASIVGRVIVKSLYDLTGDPKLQKVNLRFKIIEAKVGRAETKFLGHFVAQDYERSMTRRGTSKVYINQTVQSKDGKPLVVKSFIISLDKINKSRKNSLNAKLKICVDEIAKGENFEDLVTDIVFGKFGAKVKKELHKVYPVRHVVIKKTEIPEPVVK